jgi:collagen type I/II/III/V/XI/XXIV/XXVII alpha
VTQPPAGAIEYFHIELDRHEIILAEGLPAESYLDAGDRDQFDNGGAPLALYPDFASRAWKYAAAALVRIGPLLEAARRHLAGVAERDCYAATANGAR